MKFYGMNIFHFNFRCRSLYMLLEMFEIHLLRNGLDDKANYANFKKDLI